MRRVFSLILLGLGAFAVALAVLLPTWVYSDLAKVPLDQNSTTVLTGTASRALVVDDKGQGPTPEIRENVDITATSKVQANFGTPEMKEGTDVAVWVQATQVWDDADRKVISARKRQVCFDRRTAEGYQAAPGETEPRCAPESSFVTEVDDKSAPADGGAPGEIAVNRSQLGLNFKYPFDVVQQDYQVHEDTLGKPVTAKFEGVDEIAGTEVYKFVQTIAPTQIGTQSVPAALVDQEGDGSVDAGRFYENRVTTWVEPTTGIMIKQQQDQRQELRTQGQSSGTVVFDGTLTYDERTVAANVAQAEENMGKLGFISTTAPIVFGVGGGLLLIGGVLLFVVSSRGERGPSSAEATTPNRHAVGSDR